MNELHFGLRIRQYLNRGARDIEPAYAERLRAARELALTRQKAPAAVHFPAHVGAGPAFTHPFHSFRLPFAASPRHALLALFFCIGATVGLYCYSDYRIREAEEIDIALLADDMPVEAFVDKGFEAWLNNSPQR